MHEPVNRRKQFTRLIGTFTRRATPVPESNNYLVSGLPDSPNQDIDMLREISWTINNWHWGLSIDVEPVIAAPDLMADFNIKQHFDRLLGILAGRRMLGIHNIEALEFSPYTQDVLHNVLLERLRHNDAIGVSIPRITVLTSRTPLNTIPLGQPLQGFISRYFCEVSYQPDTEKVPPLDLEYQKLPTGRERYAERSDKKENAADFLRRVWGDLLSEKLIYSQTLHRLDSGLYSALRTYCREKDVTMKGLGIVTKNELVAARETAAYHNPYNL